MTRESGRKRAPLTKEQRSEIARRYRLGESPRRIAEAMGLSDAAVRLSISRPSRMAGPPADRRPPEATAVEKEATVVLKEGDFVAMRGVVVFVAPFDQHAEVRWNWGDQYRVSSVPLGALRLDERRPSEATCNLHPASPFDLRCVACVDDLRGYVGRRTNSATVQSESKWPCFWCGSMQAHETGYPGGMSTVPACAEHAAEYTREKSMQVQKEVMARVPTSPTRAEAIAWAKEGDPAPEGPLAWQAEPDPVATFDAWAKGSRFTEEERTTSATPECVNCGENDQMKSEACPGVGPYNGHHFVDRPSEAIPEKRPAIVTEDGTRAHVLKCWPFPFEDVKSGAKTFEYRVFDRDFRVGDVLVLEEWEPTRKAYLGPVERRRVTYLLPGGTFGVPEGRCVMGLAPEHPRTDYPIPPPCSTCAELRDRLKSGQAAYNEERVARDSLARERDEWRARALKAEASQKGGAT